jgi:chorismate lyase
LPLLHCYNLNPVKIVGQDLTRLGRFVLTDTLRSKYQRSAQPLAGPPEAASKHAKLRALLASPLSAMPTTMPPAALSPTPDWDLASQLAVPLNTVQREWLCDQGSLTRKLTEAAAQHFSVWPLQEGWQALRSDECLALGVADGSQGWVREVFLRGHQQPWVFARSVATREALDGSGLDLAHLGTRSLGELLFSDQAFQRGPLHVCRYPASWLPSAVRTEQLWARRSCFSRGALALLVVEVFLPELWQHLAGQPG